VVTTGDVTLTSGTFSQNVSAENLDEFDGNVIIATIDLANLQGSTYKILKGDGGGFEVADLVKTALKSIVVGSTTPPSTVVRLDTQEATPGIFGGYHFDLSTITPPPCVKPKVDSF